MLQGTKYPNPYPTPVHPSNLSILVPNLYPPPVHLSDLLIPVPNLYPTPVHPSDLLILVQALNPNPTRPRSQMRKTTRIAQQSSKILPLPLLRTDRLLHSSQPSTLLIWQILFLDRVHLRCSLRRMMPLRVFRMIWY